MNCLRFKSLLSLCTLWCCAYGWTNPLQGQTTDRYIHSTPVVYTQPATSDEPTEVPRPSLLQRIEQLEKRVQTDPKETPRPVKLNGRVEQEWIWMTGTEQLENEVGVLEDGVFFRRARIQASGSLQDIIDYSAEFEFAPVENIVFQDVWVQLNSLGNLGKFRAGHLKVPFGLDNENSAKHLTFFERSAVHDAFQQEYDPGIMIWDTFANGDFRYAVSYLRFDPRESGTSLSNGEHSFAARLSGTPLHSSDDRKLLHLGGAVRVNNAPQDLTSSLDGFRFRARPEFRNTPRFIDTQFFEADHAVFLGAEAALVSGPFSLQYEYVSTVVKDAVPNANLPAADLSFSGYYAQASYFVTGEHRPYSRSNGAFGRIQPNNPVNANSTMGLQWGGAVELKSRYSKVDLNDGDIQGGTLENVSVGFNWYLLSHAKVMCDYLWSRRITTSTNDSHGFGMRFYVEF